MFAGVMLWQLLLPGGLVETLPQYRRVREGYSSKAIAESLTAKVP